MKYLKPTVSNDNLFTAGKLYPVNEVTKDGLHWVVDDRGVKYGCRVDSPSASLDYKGVFKVVEIPTEEEVRQCATASGFLMGGYKLGFVINRAGEFAVKVSEPSQLKSEQGLTDRFPVVKIDAKEIMRIKEIIDPESKPASKPASDIEDQVRKALRVPADFDTVKFCKAIRNMADCWIDASK